MKGKVIVSRFWTRFFSAGRASAVTIFPFIFLRKREYSHDCVLINHERIHLARALEMLVLPFLYMVFNGVFTAVDSMQNFHQAYMRISFEREAFTYEHSQGYLKNRPRWAFMKFL